MSPERIGNSNMWKLLEGEYVRGDGGTISGPQVVRVHEFEGFNLLRIQGDINVVVRETDFIAVVKRRRRKRT